MSLIPFKKILAPVDFSEYSFKSLQNAADLAAHFGAELCILHVNPAVETTYYLAPYAPNPSDMVAYHDQMRERATNNLRTMLVFGLVAEKVIRLAPCPVLVTHAEKPQE